MKFISQDYCEGVGLLREWVVGREALINCLIVDCWITHAIYATIS